MATSEIFSLLEELLDLCQTYFSSHKKSSNSKPFINIIASIRNNISHIRPISIGLIAEFAFKYDVSEDIKANGYRSILSLLDSLLHNIIVTLQNINKEKSNVFFRNNFYIDKLGGLAEVLHQTRAIVYYAQMLIGYTESGDIFVDEKLSENILHDCDLMSKACFYGHTQGFQYYAGIQPIVQAMSTFAASYDDIRQHTSLWKTVKSAIHSGKYIVSPSQRGDKIDKLYNNFDIQFFKDFWSLPEHTVATQLQNFISVNVKVNRMFSLPSNKFSILTVDGEPVDIFYATSKESKRVKCRLISYKLYEGMNDPNSPTVICNNLTENLLKEKTCPKSKYLIFFCHGGGFVALTSKTYEGVLREWSKELNCPILSIDYSLAPESPFPEAFEECFYAYAWALKNAQYLGTSAEKVIFVGDSAGGNLILATALRVAAYNIQPPIALFPLYPACVVRFSASPSRLLSVLDPLLPTCLLTGCLTSYAGFKTQDIPFERKISQENMECGCPMQHNEKDRSQTLFTNFFKDVSEGFKGMTASASTSEMSYTRNWWDEEVYCYDTESEESLSDCETDNIGNGLTLEDSGFELLKSNDSRKTKENFSHNTIEDRDANDNKMENVNPSTNDSFSGSSLHRSISDGAFLTKNALPKSTCDIKCTPEYKIKLPVGFAPYKSRHYGKRTVVYNTPLSQNPYMSPALASDDMLKTLPFLEIVACELDPLFDDSILLVKRLNKLGVSHKFHIIRGLPHGFLNFQMCKETKEASKMCVELLKQHMTEQNQIPPTGKSDSSEAS